MEFLIRFVLFAALTVSTGLVWRRRREQHPAALTGLYFTAAGAIFLL